MLHILGASYQERNPRSEIKPQQSPRPGGDMTYGPRAIQMAPTRTLSRCAQCGVMLGGEHPRAAEREAVRGTYGGNGAGRAAPEVSMVRIAVEDPTTADARWCIRQYFAELNARFETGFNPKFSISADAVELTPPAGGLLIARLRERPVGCGAVKIHRSGVTELKRMWIGPAMRWYGLGRRMLKELERYAQTQGAKVIRLETNRALKEAISLYWHSGYMEVAAFNDEPYAHHWFEKRLTR